MADFQTLNIKGSGSFTTESSVGTLEEIRRLNEQNREKIIKAAKELGIEISLSEHVKVIQEKSIKGNRKFVKYSHETTVHLGQETKYFFNTKSLMENKLDDRTVVEKIQGIIKEQVTKSPRSEKVLGSMGVRG